MHKTAMVISCSHQARMAVIRSAIHPTTTVRQELVRTRQRQRTQGPDNCLAWSEWSAWSASFAWSAWTASSTSSASVLLGAAAPMDVMAISSHLHLCWVAQRLAVRTCCAVLPLACILAQIASRSRSRSRSRSGPLTVCCWMCDSVAHVQDSAVTVM